MKYTKTCCKHPVGADDQGTPDEIDSRPALKTLVGKKDLIGAEIGVRYGCNSLRMLHHLDIKTLYLIDKKTTTDATTNLQGFEDKIIWLVGPSHSVCSHIEDNSLDFVYIDGGHRYYTVIDDIRLYLPKVKSGGLVSGHDYKSWGLGIDVKRAVHEIFGDNINVIEPYWDWWIIK